MSAATTRRPNEAVRWDDFAGPVISGADLDPVSLSEQRVALVGDPAAVVLALSRVARHAGSVKVFQTEGVWVLPRPLVPAIPDALGSILPTELSRRITEEVGRRTLRRGVADKWTRRHLTPTGAPTRHTVVRSNRYYRSLDARSVELVTWPVAGVVEAGIRTADGLEHHVDTIVVA